MAPTVSGTNPVRSAISPKEKPSSSITKFLPVGSIPLALWPLTVNANLPELSLVNPSAPTSFVKIASWSLSDSPKDKSARSPESAPVW